MLAFPSIYHELCNDLLQQHAKLEIFSENNFVWLQNIRRKLNYGELSDSMSEKVEQHNQSSSQVAGISGSSATGSSYQEFTYESGEESSSFAPIIKPRRSSTGNPLTVLSNQLQNKKDSILSQDLSQKHITLDGTHEATSILTNNKNITPITRNPSRHVSFGRNNSESESETTSPIRPSAFDSASDTASIGSYSSDLDSARTPSPTTLARVENNVRNGVTPQRPSIAKKALQYSFDRISGRTTPESSARTTPKSYLDSSSSAASSTVGSAPSSPGSMNGEYQDDALSSSSMPPSPQKDEIEEEENLTTIIKTDDTAKEPTLVYADTSDLRLSLDPQEIIKMTADLTSPAPSNNFSVRNHTQELTDQARQFKERWMRLVSEKEKSPM